MSFKNPRDYEKRAKDICDLLGVTQVSDTKFHRLVMKLNYIESDGAEQAYARLGRNLVNVLGNIENILAEIKRIKQ